MSFQEIARICAALGGFNLGCCWLSLLTSERAQIAPRAFCSAKQGALRDRNIGQRARSITCVTAPTSLPSCMILLPAQVRYSPLVLRTMFANWQTAEEQSAAFALISELIDANALDYRAAAHECGQVGTTIFCGKFKEILCFLLL